MELCRCLPGIWHAFHRIKLCDLHVRVRTAGNRFNERHPSMTIRSSSLSKVLQIHEYIRSISVAMACSTMSTKASMSAKSSTGGRPTHHGSTTRAGRPSRPFRGSLPRQLRRMRLCDSEGGRHGWDQFFSHDLPRQGLLLSRTIAIGRAVIREPFNWLSTVACA